MYELCGYWLFLLAIFMFASVLQGVTKWFLFSYGKGAWVVEQRSFLACNC